MYYADLLDIGVCLAAMSNLCFQAKLTSCIISHLGHVYHVLGFMVRPFPAICRNKFGTENNLNDVNLTELLCKLLARVMEESKTI